MKRYVTEFYGTFFLVLTIGLVVANGTPLGALAIGAMLMVMVYMGGHVSGAHYNPAVSLALLMRGKLTPGDFGAYVVMQVLGAIAAAAVSMFVTGQGFSPAPGTDVSPIAALLIEFLFTFALALVVLNVAVSQRTHGNSFYGLAIGFTVCAAAFAGGPVSGGAFNPAVGLGPTLVHVASGGGSLAHVWIYLVGPFAGGLLAASVFGMQEA